jgi:methylmalonyl-CoA/ethylmalonyl-CoA epimerase
MSSDPTSASDLRHADIGQIAINVHDVDAAVAFYRDTLGMQHLFNAPKMAFFQCGSVRLMLGNAETAEFDHPSSVIYYRVGDIGAAHRTLAERGVVFEGEPHCVHRAADYELWLAFFRDPDRNFLALMEERKTSARA